MPDQSVLKDRFRQRTEQGFIPADLRFRLGVVHSYDLARRSAKSARAVEGSRVLIAPPPLDDEQACAAAGIVPAPVRQGPDWVEYEVPVSTQPLGGLLLQFPYAEDGWMALVRDIERFARALTSRDRSGFGLCLNDLHVDENDAGWCVRATPTRVRTGASSIIEMPVDLGRLDLVPLLGQVNKHHLDTPVRLLDGSRA